jgi:hypothetical protein
VDQDGHGQHGHVRILINDTAKRETAKSGFLRAIFLFGDPCRLPVSKRKIANGKSDFAVSRRR